jgi:hypothetical protein
MFVYKYCTVQIKFSNFKALKYKWDFLPKNATIHNFSFQVVTRKTFVVIEKHYFI